MVAIIGRLPEIPRTRKQAWLLSAIERLGFKRACIALANKTARTAWVMLRYETGYKHSPLMI